MCLLPYWGKGVMSFVTGMQRVLITKPKCLVFGVNFLMSYMLDERELTKIRVEYHIHDSMAMRVPELLECLNNPQSEVVFFTDVFKSTVFDCC